MTTHVNQAYLIFNWYNYLFWNLFCSISTSDNEFYKWVRKGHLTKMFSTVNNLYINTVLTLSSVWEFSWRLVWKKLSSSSCHALSTDILDPLSPPLHIVYCFWKVFRATSRNGTELLCVCSSWSSCLCSSMWRGPQEYITYEFQENWSLKLIF